MKRLFFVLICATGFGCQSRQDAVQVICESPNAVGRVGSADKIVAIQKYLHENVKNEEVAAVLMQMRTKSTREQIQILRRLQKETDLPYCPLLDVYAAKARLMQR